MENENFTKEEVLEILTQFTTKCVHDSDFDQGQSLDDTLSVMLSWWNAKINSENEYDDSDEPYLIKYDVTVSKVYNPNYGDDRICECGHPYHRHFDSYENMENVGCKYCDCFDFKERE